MTPAPRVVILAAGASSRLGEPKALARLGSGTALAHLVRSAHALDPRPLVIVGAHAREIRTLAPEGCDVVENPRWREGRVSGLELARTLRAGADLCVAPVDAPLVAASTLEALGRAWLEHGAPALGWLAPRVPTRNRHGHPIVLGRELAGGLEGTSDLRELRSRAVPLLSVDVEDERVLDDLDTPEDLARLRDLL